MTKRRKDILTAIDNGDFGLCFLYDRFRLTYKTLKNHVAALEAEGLVDWDHEADHSGTFTMTLKGRELVRPFTI